MTFDDMTFKEKVEHIWEYYKIHMAVAGGVVLLIASLLNIYLINPAPDIILDVTARMGQAHYNTEYQNILRDALVEEVVDYPESQTVTVELLPTDDSLDPNTVMATEAKFMGKAEVQEMDIFLVDEDNFRYMLSEGFFMDIVELEKQYGIALNADAKIKSIDPATQEERVFALDAKKLPGMLPLINDNDGANYYVGIFVRSLSEENAMKALKFMGE